MGSPGSCCSALFPESWLFLIENEWMHICRDQVSQWKICRVTTSTPSSSVYRIFPRLRRRDGGRVGGRQWTFEGGGPRSRIPPLLQKNVSPCLESRWCYRGVHYVWSLVFFLRSLCHTHENKKETTPGSFCRGAMGLPSKHGLRKKENERKGSIERYDRDVSQLNTIIVALGIHHSNGQTWVDWLTSSHFWVVLPLPPTVPTQPSKKANHKYLAHSCLFTRCVCVSIPSLQNACRAHPLSLWYGMITNGWARHGK